jgi:DNA-directed RNA polymerase subunit RPC12/RpoP
MGSEEDINYCPKCGSEVKVAGTDIEDRRVADCPECGVVEIVYYRYHNTASAEDVIG